MANQYQVAIVGGGPVGVALAVELGLRGIACVLVERRTGLANIPKGQNLTQRTLEHFYFWGIDEALRAARLMPAGYPIGTVTAYGSLTSPYWYAAPARELVGKYYFQDVERLPQYQTEKVLRARMAELPTVEARFGWNAKRFRQDVDGVALDIVDAAGTRTTVTADYLVGCDGARSIVRDQLGIGSGGADFDQQMVLAVFRSRELHEGLKRFPDRSTYNVMRPENHGYWQFFGRIDVGEGWFFHAPVPKDAHFTTEQVHDLIQEAAGFSFAATFEHVGFWDLRVSVAERYRDGRVFIAGDAAHSHPPYGGFGLNSGLEDITNLGWKLAATLEGWGGEPLLDSYGEERRPIFYETAEDFIARRIRTDNAFLQTYNPERDRAAFEEAWSQRSGGIRTFVQTYEPNYEGSPVIDGPPGGLCSAHGTHSFEARPGHHLSPQKLSSGRNVFEELGHGFTLLALGPPDSEIDGFRAAAENLAIPLKIVRDDCEGGLVDYKARYILVRPDQHVAWVSDAAPPHAERVLARAIGRDDTAEPVRAPLEPADVRPG